MLNIKISGSRNLSNTGEAIPVEARQKDEVEKKLAIIVDCGGFADHLKALDIIASDSWKIDRPAAASEIVDDNPLLHPFLRSRILSAVHGQDIPRCREVLFGMICDEKSLSSRDKHWHTPDQAFTDVLISQSHT